MWNELGISGGTAIVILIALYFVIKWAVKNGIKEACDYVTDVTLFDVYEGIQLGPDKKSMAFSVVFTPADEEFTTERVEGFVKKILKNLEKTLDIRLRA